MLVLKNNSSFDCESMVKYGAITILLRKEWHRLVKDPLGFKLKMNNNNFIRFEKMSCTFSKVVISKQILFQHDRKEASSQAATQL